MSIIASLENTLISISGFVPLELFVFIGSFVEEVVAPIPSPLIMITAGSLASLQGRAIAGLVILSLVGAIGKTLGAVVLYVVADKSEDILTSKFGRFLGIGHKELESIGKYFNKGRWDDLILLGIRSLPIVPSAPVSIICGLIRINLKTFVTATFFGTIIRDGIFLYFGYSGAQSFNSLIHGLDTVETAVQILVFFALGLLIGWAYWKRRQRNKS